MNAAGQTRLKIRIRAVADENMANRTHEAFVARRPRIAKFKVRATSGATSRTKLLRIEGNPQVPVAELEALV